MTSIVNSSHSGSSNKVSEESLGEAELYLECIH